MQPIIAFVNHKGGVAKTLSTYHIGLQFAMHYMAPLLIDLDPQANLTRRCNGVVSHDNTIGSVLGGAVHGITSIIDAMQGITLGDSSAWLLPSDIMLTNVAAGLQNRNFNRLTGLANALAAAQNNLIGPVLIDTPPEAGVLTLNALVAASHVVICTDPEQDGIAGVARIVEFVEMLRAERVANPVILGTIVTRVRTGTVGHQLGLDRLALRNMPPILGIVPSRVGQDAADRLAESYADIAEMIRLHINGETNPPLGARGAEQNA